VEREGRVRTAVSGLETWRISKIMLLPQFGNSECDFHPVLGKSDYLLDDALLDQRIRGWRHGRPSQFLKAQAARLSHHPRAPRTRKNQARPARSKPYAKMKQGELREGMV
jgi:hypothetical protein